MCARCVSEGVCPLEMRERMLLLTRAMMTCEAEKNLQAPSSSDLKIYKHPSKAELSTQHGGRAALRRSLPNDAPVWTHPPRRRGVDVVVAQPQRSDVPARLRSARMARRHRVCVLAKQRFESHDDGSEGGGVGGGGGRRRARLVRALRRNREVERIVVDRGDGGGARKRCAGG